MIVRLRPTALSRRGRAAGWASPETPRRAGRGDPGQEPPGARHVLRVVSPCSLAAPARAPRGPGSGTATTSGTAASSAIRAGTITSMPTVAINHAGGAGVCGCGSDSGVSARCNASTTAICLSPGSPPCRTANASSGIESRRGSAAAQPGRVATRSLQEGLRHDPGEELAADTRDRRCTGGGMQQVCDSSSATASSARFAGSAENIELRPVSARNSAHDRDLRFAAKHRRHDPSDWWRSDRPT
jgi:hypothetical protein